MAASNEASIERAISLLTDAIAKLLLEHGVTAARLDQIAKASFVKAGAKGSRKKSSGRPHLAQIAAKTGLTRSEVKRIVSGNFAFAPASPESWPRAKRVLNAWKSSKQYSYNGRPKRLPITGARGSFASLCRLHSGDIPPRVILSELERAGYAKTNAGRTHVSFSPIKTNRNLRDVEAALTFAASFLDYALKNEVLLLRRMQQVAVSSELPPAYIEDAITDRVSEMLDQMPKLFPMKKTGTRSRVRVFALVAREPRK